MEECIFYCMCRHAEEANMSLWPDPDWICGHRNHRYPQNCSSFTNFYSFLSHRRVQTHKCPQQIKLILKKNCIKYMCIYRYLLYYLKYFVIKILCDLDMSVYRSILSVPVLCFFSTSFCMLLTLHDFDLTDKILQNINEKWSTVFLTKI